MTASIRIDDGTNPPVQTTDNPFSFLGVSHTLSNFDDSGVLGHRWTLVDKPIGSSGALSSTSTPTTTLTPDVPGNYLVRLQTYLDAARTILNDSDEQIVGVRFDAPFDWAIPAAGETTQQNTSRGWAQSRERAIRDIHAFMQGGMPQLTGVVNEELDGADPETVFGGFVLDGSNFPDNALKLRIVGRITVAGAGTGELRLYDLGPVAGPAAVPIQRATVEIENAANGDVVVRDQGLTPAAAPGVNANEVHAERRIYEVRARMVGASGGDKLKIHHGGVVLEG